MALGFDATQQHATGSGTSIALPAFSTSGTNRIICIVSTHNTPVISSITGGLTWTGRAVTTGIELWWALAAAQQTGVVFTINYNASATFISADIFAVSGANTSTPFDTNGALPSLKTTSAHATITTTNANDFLIGAYRFGTTPSPTQGTGWTKISGADYQLVEYKIVAATQSALDVPIGTGDGDSNGGIGDAIQEAATAGSNRLTLLGVG